MGGGGNGWSLKNSNEERQLVLSCIHVRLGVMFNQRLFVCRQIDPSWWTNCAISRSSQWDDAYNRTLASNQKE